MARKTEKVAVVGPAALDVARIVSPGRKVERILTGGGCTERDHILEVFDGEGKLCGWIRENGELHYEDRDGMLLTLKEG